MVPSSLARTAFRQPSAPTVSLKVKFGTAPAVFVLAAVACAAPPRPTPEPVARNPIDTLAIAAHASYLATDLLAGRRAGSPGARMATEYVANVCGVLGLQPVGSDDFFQPIPLLQVAIRHSELEVVTPAGRSVFASPRDFVTDLDLGTSLHGFAGPIVVAASPLGAQPLPEVRGAIVVTEALQDRVVLDQLRALGAAGLVLAVRDQERYDLYARSRGTTRLLLDQENARSSLLRPLPTIAVSPTVATFLLDSGAPAPESGSTRLQVELRMDVERSRVPDRNVLCMLSGTDPRARDTAIVFTAHLDHLGIGIPDARGDSVYNGFSDNAAGVAMLLAIARAFQHQRYLPRHSVVFLFTAAEEQGLLGADYYAAHPQWPLERTLAVINLDAGAPPAPPTSWRLAGEPGSPLALLASDVAHAHGWSATVTPATPNSDHYPLLRAGVPAIFVIPGPGPYQGISMDSSRALKARWDAYHQPGDEWSDAFPLAGLQRYAEYALLIAHALDRGLTPVIYPGPRRGRLRR